MKELRQVEIEQERKTILELMRVELGTTKAETAPATQPQDENTRR